jgi:hypothetical protein
MFEQRDRFWLKQQFDQLDAANLVILAGIRNIEHTLKHQNIFLIPELENMINQVSRRALSIDKKVPDKQETHGEAGEY